MTTIAASPAARPSIDARSGRAGVFVAFGITGDLAKVMTFMSLYRLERRTPVHAYPPDTRGPKAADKRLDGHGRWHDPWVTS